jgi:hypothetical protein
MVVASCRSGRRTTRCPFPGDRNRRLMSMTTMVIVAKCGWMGSRCVHPYWRTISKHHVTETNNGQNRWDGKDNSIQAHQRYSCTCYCNEQ